ncbi:hypothetical protein Vadar_000392 [Vaccinium darrowii]|uniref:Uncharacterized protein n=1 Tax=Vaccinium darrowii TaxID=229202 RepID=A0ACB7ZGB7_9ERIC|nr:hypothetical protein Vadar_000392 [Vaccinium darrowii]
MYEEGEDTEWVNVHLENKEPSENDWVGVFLPAKFNSSNCFEVRDPAPYICSAASPHKVQVCKFLQLWIYKNRQSFSEVPVDQSAGRLLLCIIYRRPKLVAVSNNISFANPKAPLYPRLAQGKSWDEAHLHGQLAGEILVSFTSFLKGLWPNYMYTYRMGHLLSNGSHVWSKMYSFKSSPYPGQDSLQRVVIFGDMGTGQCDGSNEYNYNQPGSLNTTDQLIKDLKNIDIIFHIGDITYAKGVHLTM